MTSSLFTLVSYLLTHHNESFVMDAVCMFLMIFGPVIIIAGILISLHAIPPYGMRGFFLGVAISFIVASLPLALSVPFLALSYERYSVPEFNKTVVQEVTGFKGTARCTTKGFFWEGTYDYKKGHKTARVPVARVLTNSTTCSVGWHTESPSRIEAILERHAANFVDIRNSSLYQNDDNGFVDYTKPLPSTVSTGNDCSCKRTG